jgi:hypothetical protein
MPAGQCPKPGCTFKGNMVQIRIHIIEMHSGKKKPKPKK